MYRPRSAFAVTCSVWKALFLREAVSRLFKGRATWFWMFFEPIFHVAYLVLIYNVLRVRSVGGIDTTVWLIIGLLAFFMFRRTGMQSMQALSANESLFAYRQVKPVDTVLVRCALEGFLMVIIAALLLCAAAILGYPIIPADPLKVVAAFFGLWLFGVGFGLLASVTNELIEELGNVLKIMMMPLYMVSGVVFPLSAVPLPYRDWLMHNPVAHGLELARAGFAPYYHAVPGVSMDYLYGSALAVVFFGLALHRRFELRLATQ